MKAKPCLGGWRHKATATVYWNACTQTGPQHGATTVERVAQTEYLVDKSTVTQQDVGVQSCSFPDARDKLLEAFTFDHGSRTAAEVASPPKDSARNRRILDSVVKIQRFYRARRGRIAVAASPMARSDSEDTDGQQIAAEEPRSYRSRDFVILNRSSPRTRTDFELLYNLLDRWRVRETEKADPLPRLASSRIGLCSLILSKEVELLRAIDTLKTAEKLRRRQISYRKFLDRLSLSIVWKNRLGEPILVDTPRVLLARILKGKFDGLSREDVSPEDRRETLQQLREDVAPHTCRASNEVIRLLDQEIDFLDGDVDVGKLSWLRSRLRISFLAFARDTLAREFEDFPCPGSSNRLCRSCGRLLSPEKFATEKRRRSSSCNHCLYVRARTGPRIVYGPYESLLRDVRRNEAKLRCYSSFAFVVDAKIVYHLVNDIWHGRSAISENDRLSELRLVRFQRDLEWSPWNCLLLTSREAAVHRRLEEPANFYGPMILQKFHTRNLQAKVQFGIETGRGKNPRA
ncbi:IQ motif and ubiquitin-like domain-containing protein [Megalopta genalis]|uniref:IQ motif and ubiquitin-like domain-containing protein n=1 Tax=Megalopta genalis TaxID=115081 RepID=UPI003FD0092D